jgi:hypothetical protein
MPCVLFVLQGGFNTKTMRIIFTILLAAFCSLAYGQKVEYRHDSLFINDYFVDAQTGNPTLDSLLESKGKTRRSTDKYSIDSSTGKKLKLTTRSYNDLGLLFRRYDDDPTKLSVRIKLYRETDAKRERKDELTETFGGELYIAGNYLNGKRTLAQLKELRNCTVTTSSISFGSYTGLLGGDIVYGENVIRLAFDKQTSELISVFIHHNFKER